MDSAFATLADNLIVPTILFFVLGLVASFLRSDLSVPGGAAKFMSLYLLLAIGFKGGVQLAENGIGPEMLSVIGAGVLLSFALPFLAFGLLRVMTQLDHENAAAIAGHYGSISIVTFVTATSILSLSGIPYPGYMVAVAAAMEVPAIISALWLASRGPDKVETSKVWRDIFANGSILLLIGAFVIGFATGADGAATIDPFIGQMFMGVLCLFLLDMGLRAGQSLISHRQMLSAQIFAFGLLMPLTSAALAYALGMGLGMSGAGLFLFLVLAASASYIAVPAAMQIALPRAQAGIYLTLALGVTFPFNLTVGIPLYYWIAM